MFKDIVTKIVVHSFNGDEGDAQFVEIDGVKYVPDETDTSKPKIGEDGEKVKFEEAEPETPPEPEPKPKDGEKSLEDLAKENPAVARLLEDKKKLEEEKEKEAEEARKAAEAEAEKNGEWQKLAEERGAEAERLRKELGQKGEILEKYVGSVKQILANALEDIPEETRGLIPEGFSPREKLEYITKNAKLLGLKPTAGKGGKVDPNEVDPNATPLEKLVSEFEELQKKENKTNADFTKMAELGKKIKAERAKKDE